MDVLIQSLIGSGPLGVVCFIILQQMRADRAERLAFDQARLDTDKKLAVALTALALKITGKLPDGDPS